MKKRFLFLAVVGILVVALAAPSAFGAITGNDQNGQNPQYQQFFNQMFDWHQQWLDQAQRNGQISTDQAKAWQDHFNYMRDFHNQNGFGPMGSMMGGNGFNGMMGNFNGSGGYGGMMGGYYNQAPSK